MTSNRFRSALRSLRAVLGVLLASAVVIGLARLVTEVLPAMASACKTTHTYTHTTTSAGSESWTWKTRYACGRAYTLREHKIFSSYTGSHYDENIYRDEMAYPHYRQVTDKYSWSRRGVETHTWTVKTG